MCRQNLVMFWQLFKQRKMVGEFSYHVNQGSLTMSHRVVNKSFGLQGINVELEVKITFHLLPLMPMNVFH